MPLDSFARIAACLIKRFVHWPTKLRSQELKSLSGSVSMAASALDLGSFIWLAIKADQDANTDEQKHSLYYWQY